MNSNSPVAVFDTHVFPASYVLGRKQWQQQVARLAGATSIASYPCSGVTPEGEALSTDTVWIGDKDAPKVLVLISGTHGIEGFAGSAVEIDFLNLLRAGQFIIPSNTAVLVIHALTPWGYAWHRRCDADGVDLNRNVVDFSQPLPENRGYDLLRPVFFLPDVQQRKQAYAEFAHQHGREALETAISGGQYNDPAGPFYGGKAPTHGRLVTEQLIREHSLQQRDLAVIDLHTGLGSYGYGEIICDHQPDSTGTRMAHAWYGDSVTLPLLGTSSSVPKTGLLDYAWHAIMNERSCYITLEFGTFSTEQLFEVLLRDHQLWAQATDLHVRFAQAKAMRHHFCPHEQAWQEMVLFRARQVISQALRGVSS